MGRRQLVVDVGEIFFRERYHAAPHPTLVDKDVFEMAQGILQERGEDPSVRRSNSSEYLLTGLIVCDRCGKKFVGAAAKGTKYRYPYYVCFSRQRYGTHECPQDRLRAEEMEEKLIQSLVATLNRSDVIEEAVSRWASQQGKDRPKLEKELAAVDGQIRKSESALDRYFNAFEAGSMTEATCSARVQKLAGEIAALTTRRAELSEELSEAAPDVPDDADLAEFRDETLAALESGNHAQRKALLQTLVVEISRQGSLVDPTRLLRADISTTVWIGAPNGIRTRVTTLKGWDPRPLDDGSLRARIPVTHRRRAPVTKQSPRLEDEGSESSA
jgi:site-specific DNA recombinase